MQEEIVENAADAPDCDCAFSPVDVQVAPSMHDSIGAIALAVGFAFLLVAFMRLLDRYQALLADQAARPPVQ